MTARKDRQAPERRSLSAKEIAARHGLAVSTVYGMIRAGELGPVLRLGKSIRVPVDAVEAWEREHLEGWAAVHSPAAS